MADYIVSQTYKIDDQVTDTAGRMADALNAVADAADHTDAVVTKAGPSAASLANRYDESTRAAKALATAQAQLQNATATMTAAVASGQVSQATANNVLDALAGKVRAAQAAQDQLTGAVGAGTAAVNQAAGAHGAAAAAAGHLSIANAGVTRELIVMGHEAMTGNFNKIPGSLVVMLERTGGLHEMLEKVGAALISPWGIASVAIAGTAVAFGLITARAEQNQRAMLELSAQLQKTRDDYAAIAAEATGAAKAIAATTPGVSKADALAAAGIISGSPQFAGDQAQLQALLKLSDDLARSFKITLPEAARQLAAAFADPTKAAQALQSEGLRTMNESLLLTVQNLQQSGDKAGATSLVLGSLKGAVGGAAEQMTPLQLALHELAQQFVSTDSAAGKVSHTFGDTLESSLAQTIHDITALVKIVQELTEGFQKLMDMGPKISAPQLPQWLTLQGLGAAMSGASVGPTPNVSNIPSNQVTQDIRDAAQGLAMSPELTNLALAMAQAESHFQQIDPKTGTTLRSDAGALGVMQLMPKTAAGLGVDPNDYAQNILGGLKLIQQLDNEFGHNTMAIAAAYNMGPAAYRNAANTGSALPNETQAYLGKIFGGAVAMPAPVTLPTVDVTATAKNTDKDAIDSGLKLAQSIGSQAETADTLAAKLAGLRTAQDAVNKSMADGSLDSQEGARDLAYLQGAVEKLTGQQSNNLDAVQQLVRSYKDQEPALATADGATRTLAEAQQKLVEAARTAGRDPSATEYADVMAGALAKLNSQLRDTLDNLNRQIAGQQLIATAYDHGATSAAAASNAVKAEDEARKVAVPGTDAYAAAVDALTTKYNQLTAAQVDNAERQKQVDYQQQLEYIRAEASLVTADNTARQTQLAILKERQAVLKAGGDPDSGAALSAQRMAAQVAAANVELQRQQQVITDISNLADQAFSTVGQAIANAFASGSGAAVNWGNITRTVIASIATEVAKLAILNPLLNSVFGGNRTTLADAAAAVAGTSGAASGVAGASSLGGLGSLASSLGNIFTSGSGVLSSGLDLWAANTLGINLGSVNALQGPTISGAALSGSGAATQGLFSGGSALAGFGSLSNALGIGGSILPGLLSGNYGQAAAGGIGAAIGTAILPGIGTVLGGLGGNLLGGLFGNSHPQNPFSNVEVKVTGAGDFAVGQSLSQRINNAADQAAAAAGVQSANAVLQANGVRVVANAGQTAFGIGSGIANYPQFANFNSGFASLRFTSADPTIANGLAGQSFSDPTALQAAISSIQTFVNQTMPALIAGAQGVTASTDQYATALQNVKDTYGAAIAEAQRLGLATTDLTAAQAQAAQVVIQRQELEEYAAAATFTEAGLNAQAMLTGESSYSEQASLMAFDVSAAQQKNQYSDMLAGIYGASYLQTQDYANKMAAAEASLAQQRLAIQAQYNQQATALQDQAAKSATSAVDSLTSYVLKLETGSGSPLSAVDQYKLASQQFDVQAVAAQNGSASAIANLTTYADAFLSASQNVNGSGVGYVGDFNRVVAALNNVANASQDSLTASFFAQQTQTQTATLVDSLASLKSELTALRQQVAQNAAQPARVS